MLHHEILSSNLKYGLATRNFELEFEIWCNITKLEIYFHENLHVSRVCSQFLLVFNQQLCNFPLVFHIYLAIRPPNANDELNPNGFTFRRRYQYRIQEHCQQDSERTEAVTARQGAGAARRAHVRGRRV